MSKDRLEGDGREEGAREGKIANLGRPQRDCLERRKRMSRYKTQSGIELKGCSRDPITKGFVYRTNEKDILEVFSWKTKSHRD